MTEKKKKLKLVFVCTGNTCRSPMAEAIVKKKLKERKLDGEFTVTSAGIYAQPGAPMSKNAAAALAQLGYPVKAHKAKPLRPALIKSAHMIVCMTAGHKARIESDRAYTVASLTGGPEVGDPFGQDVEAYLAVARYLAYAADDIVTAAVSLQKSPSNH